MDHNFISYDELPLPFYLVKKDTTTATLSKHFHVLTRFGEVLIGTWGYSNKLEVSPPPKDDEKRVHAETWGLDGKASHYSMNMPTPPGATANKKKELTSQIAELEAILSSEGALPSQWDVKDLKKLAACREMLASIEEDTHALIVFPGQSIKPICIGEWKVEDVEALDASSDA